jgi:phosphate transport system substrate-binding protein
MFKSGKYIKILSAICLVAVMLTSLSPAFSQTKADPKLPKYKKVSGISGSLSSVGSDTMNNLMALWLEGFKKYYPNVKIQIEGKGSGTAPPALIEGTSQLAPMSRVMKSEEIDKFEKKYGYKPTQIKVSLDGISVYVNKDNPLKGLAMDQIDAIFSKTLRSGYKSEITTWGQAGAKGDWAK